MLIIIIINVIIIITIIIIIIKYEEISLTHEFILDFIGGILPKEWRQKTGLRKKNNNGGWNGHREQGALYRRRVQAFSTLCWWK